MKSRLVARIPFVLALVLGPLGGHFGARHAARPPHHGEFALLDDAASVGGDDAAIRA